jgi:hypothetical protein
MKTEAGPPNGRRHGRAEAAKALRERYGVTEPEKPEAEEASKEAAKRAAAEAEKKALLDHFTKPSGISDEEAIRRGIKIIERAVANGRTEVQVHRFPNQLCTDKGRAIIQQEAGWENTLTGVPKEIYVLWAKYFRPRGYKLRVEIVEYPGGLPGDVGMTLKWG